jgi:hypothetical protein
VLEHTQIRVFIGKMRFYFMLHGEGSAKLFYGGERQLPFGGSAGSCAAPRYIAETVAAFGNESGLKAKLGNDIREMVDHENGEIFTVRKVPDCSLRVVLSPAQKRAQKWMRKAALVEILGKKHRVACCHRNPIKQVKLIQVWAKLGVYLPGHYVGLQTCALPWLCSICSPKIGERRAVEIQKAMAQCLSEGGQVLMPTFTIPHGRHQPLAETLNLIKEALRWMARHRQYKQLQDRLGVDGRIIGTEINHGEANGWHPHFHELWFFERSGIDVEKLEQELYELWKKACLKFGLGEPSRKHGVVVQDGQGAAKYVAKMGEKQWTLADEMAKANAKSGRKSNRSFWQLIDCYMDESASPQSRNRAKQLILEYAEVTKGKKALTWTPGLKKRYAVIDMTDKELAAQVEEEAVLIAEIPLDDWRIVVKHKLEAVILDVCLNGKDAVNMVINAYRNLVVKRPREVLEPPNRA